MDARAARMMVALSFVGLSIPVSSMPPAFVALHQWLDCWSGIGAIEQGMAGQGFDLALTRYANEGWRAVAAGSWGCLGRPESECGRLCHGDGAHKGGDRCRRVLMLPTLESASFRTPIALTSGKAHPLVTLDEACGIISGSKDLVGQLTNAGVIRVATAESQTGSRLYSRPDLEAVARQLYGDGAPADVAVGLKPAETVTK